MTRWVRARWPADAGPVVTFAGVSATALLAAPAIAAQLATEWRLSPSAIGFYFTIEQGGMCLATLPAIWWLKAVAWRRVAIAAAVIFIFANLLSTQAHSLEALLPLRALSALSGGTLMVLSMTLAGRSAQRERLFGLWVLGQLVVGALLLFLLPRLFAISGLWSLYLVLAGLAAVSALLFVSALPSTITVPKAGTKTGRLDLGAAVVGIGGILIYYIAYGGVWPFMARIADGGGMNAVESGTILAIGSLFGVAGALLAIALADRKGQGVLLGGYVLMALAVAALWQEPPLARFALAAFVLKGASTFTLPFILGRVASLDSGGRLMGVTNMAIGGGLAIGPLLAGGIIEFGGGLAVMIGLGVVAMLSSGALILSLRWRPAPISAPLKT